MTNQTNYAVVTIGTDDVTEWIDDETAERVTPKHLELAADLMGQYLNTEEYELIKRAFCDAIEAALAELPHCRKKGNRMTARP